MILVEKANNRSFCLDSETEKTPLIEGSSCDGYVHVLTGGPYCGKMLPLFSATQETGDKVSTTSCVAACRDLFHALTEAQLACETITLRLSLNQ